MQNLPNVILPIFLLPGPRRGRQARRDAPERHRGAPREGRSRSAPPAPWRRDHRYHCGPDLLPRGAELPLEDCPGRAMQAGRGEREKAGRTELLANRPYWAGPPLSAPRCRPRAVGPTLTVWYFFLLLLHFRKIPKKFDQHVAEISKILAKFAKILENISKHFANF